MEGAVEAEVKEAGDAKADLGKMNDNENYNGKSEAVTVVSGDSETAPAAPAAENEAADDVDLEDGEIEDDDEEEEQVHQMEQ